MAVATRQPGAVEDSLSNESEAEIGLREEVRLRAEQMGAADRVGGLAIGIVVVGVVLNQMNSLSIVNSSSSVIDVTSILETAGNGLNLLTLAIIALAAGVILQVFRSSF